MTTTRKLKANEPGFWPKWFGKLLFTLISVKVWGLIACTCVSTWLLMIHLNHKPIIVGESIIEYGINGAQWVTFNTTIWALIFGMKEIFRISEQSDYSEQQKLRENLDSKLKIAGMLSCGNPDCEKDLVSDGFERVGVEPDDL
jgi:hypothetical protein